MTLQSEMYRQYPMGQDKFICNCCKNYKGSLSCKKYIFIAFDGANMSHCTFFEYGKRCPHCGIIS